MIDINISQISKSFLGNEILVNINMYIQESFTYCLLGRNGAGKSTLINIMLDLIESDSGYISFNGESLKHNLQIKKQIGVLLENHQVIDEIDGYSYLEYIGKLYGVPKKILSERIDTLINYFFESPDEVKKNIGKFSTGMKKKIGFCATILHKPDILILDEPFSGLDPISANLLVNTLAKYQNGKRVIFLSSHDLNYVQKIATHIGVIEKSHLIYNDTLNNFTNHGKNQLDYSLLQIINHDETQKNVVEWI